MPGIQNATFFAFPQEETWVCYLEERMRDFRVSGQCGRWIARSPVKQFTGRI